MEPDKPHNVVSIPQIIRVVGKILGLIFVVLLAALLVWVKLQPDLKPLNRNNVSPTLLGYTNDASGTMLARIAITNLSGLLVYVYQPLIEIPAATEPSGATAYPPGQAYYHSDFFRWHSTLDSGASVVFTVPVPTNLSPWRLRFFADPDIGTARAIVRTVGALTFSPAARRLPYSVRSDWIETKRRIAAWKKDWL
jgi:hypothetical protein